MKIIDTTIQGYDELMEGITYMLNYLTHSDKQSIKDELYDNSTVFTKEQFEALLALLYSKPEYDSEFSEVGYADPDVFDILAINEAFNQTEYTMDNPAQSTDYAFM